VNSFDPRTAFAVAGILYFVMPLTVWSILRNRYEPQNVRRWCLGGLLFGLGLGLVGLRGAIPSWLSIGVANPIAFASYALRIGVMDRELAAPSRSTAIGVAWALLSAAFLAAHAMSDMDAPRLVISNLAHFAGASMIAVLAWRLHRRRASGSAAMLAAAYAVFAAALVTRMSVVVLEGRGASALSTSLDFALMFITAVVAALFGNLGYLGMALEAISGRELQRAAELAREQAQRQNVERFSQEQAAMLKERTAMLAQRDEMLATLAHEVRQPLNNASAAVESASAVLHGATPRDVAAAAQRLQRASSVLMRVMSSVDNTLADAALLGRERPLSMADGDIDTVVQLAVADMDPAERSRVRVVRDTATRTACFNLSLLRLALRNLVRNALLHSRPGSPVTIRIADSDSPLALLIDVCDEGPGVDPALAPRLFQRGARGAGAPPGHGLGLYIVRSVMHMHGGEASLHANGPDGAQFRLTLPAIHGAPGTDFKPPAASP
jgi:signal transduction histidine kinase